LRTEAVIEICMSPDLGGLELYMAQASLSLSKHLHVIPVVKSDSALEPYFKDKIPFISIDKKSNIFMFSSAKKLANIIDENSVKLIHLHWTKDIPFVVLAKLLSKSKPKIMQSRHMTMTRFKDDFYHNFLYNNIDIILAVTNQVKEQLEKFIPSTVRPKIVTLYPGAKESPLLGEEKKMQLKKELGFSPKSFNVGMVGRINKDKGQYLLIEAVKILKEKGLDVNAYFVGNAMQKSYLDELKQSVLDKKLQENIFFLGFMKTPSEFYQLCDAVVLASKRETFGLVLVEAMRMKSAVLGSKSGGVVEIIDDEKTGLFFEPENVNSLADKIELFMKDRDFLELIKERACNKSIEMFDSKKQFEKLAMIIKEELEC